MDLENVCLIMKNKISLNKTSWINMDFYSSWMLSGKKKKEMRKRHDGSCRRNVECGWFQGCKTYDAGCNPGLGIHEMGTARMGRDPKTSVLNGNNQLHSVKNVFATDGSFMTSASCVNPSLTYMAFTARAANFAVEELKKGNL